MKQVVCVSTSPWYPIPTRKQQVMRRLKDVQVLYFDPPVSYLAPLKDKAAKEKLRAYRNPGEQVKENITVYSVPPVLPFFNKFRFINKLNQFRLSRFIRKKMKQHGFDDAVLWCYSPTSADLAPHVPHKALVYDCVDRHSAYGGLMNPAVVDKMEEDLAAQADQVFATADALARRLRESNTTACCIPNGAEYELFARARQPQPCPEDIANLPRPILGFVGALQECIEYSYLYAAAQAHPEWSFVLIGAEKPGADLKALKTCSNVHFLGLKPHDQLPQYIAQFSLCLNLFADNALSRDVSPLKFYEYLATGKPVVSTPQPQQVLQFSDAIEIAGSEEDFIAACARAIHDTDPAREAQRAEYGRKSSWDSRVEEIESVLHAHAIL